MANRIPCFDSSHLEAICKVLADTNMGLKGDEIGYILKEMELADPDSSMTKWKRLFNALALAQNTHNVGNHLILFINKAMQPVRYTNDQEKFNWRREGLNVSLVFSGYRVREDGQVGRTTPETTLAGAKARAGKLRAILEARNTHHEVFVYCRAELLEENYFHAVFEASKGLSQRIRNLSGLSSDGAELVNEALSIKNPLIAFSSLTTTTEQSEQKGIVNLMIGLFGAIRNPIAHAPKTMWVMPEQDAIDIFALISFIHRKLDNAVKPNLV